MIQILTGAWHDFTRTWPTLLATDLVYKLIAFVILTPLVGVALRAFVSLSGESVLADQDILFFALSPIGIVTVIAVVGAAMAITAAEQAALMTIAFGALRERKVGTLEALSVPANRLLSTLGLTASIVVRVLLVAAPFLVAGGLVYAWLLTQHDINYYLTERPSELYLAAGLIAAIVVALGLVLARKLIGWVYALPVHLFENVRARDALATSAERTKGRIGKVTLVLAAWTVLSILLGALALGAVGALGRFLVPRADSSVGAPPVRHGRSHSALERRESNRDSRPGGAVRASYHAALPPLRGRRGGRASHDVD